LDEDYQIELTAAKELYIGCRKHFSDELAEAALLSAKIHGTKAGHRKEILAIGAEGGNKI
jgi:hypothetical protein